MKLKDLKNGGMRLRERMKREELRACQEMVEEMQLRVKKLQEYNDEIFAEKERVANELAEVKRKFKNFRNNQKKKMKEMEAMNEQKKVEQVYKVATHNSATGEKGLGWLSWLVAPFSVCQGKTLKEQHAAGARLFDIRVKRVNGVWRCGHGLWTTKRLAVDIIHEIEQLGDSMVQVVFEGGLEECEEFKSFAVWLKSFAPALKFTDFYIKRGSQSEWLRCEYEMVERGNAALGGDLVAGFQALDGTTWHTLLPIPWLWAKKFKRPPYSENYWVMVDFL